MRRDMTMGKGLDSLSIFQLSIKKLTTNLLTTADHTGGQADGPIGGIVVNCKG
jgi:hypothetical protein